MEALIKMTDEQLVALYSTEGNNEAFDILLQRHQQGIFNYIFFIVKDSQLAEDIFQETFVKAIVNIKRGRYTETGRFRGWVSRIAYNLIIDHFRQQKSENTVSNDNAPFDLLNDKALCEGTIEDSLVHTQIVSDVRKLVSFLPDNQREVV